MSAVRGYRDLIVWQKALDLTDPIYRLSRSFPRDEMFGLTSQIRRAAVSVSLNIAEGSGRRTKGEYSQFLGIARGSIHELSTLVEICRRQGLIEPEECDRLFEAADEIGRMLTGLISKLTDQESKRQTRS